MNLWECTKPGCSNTAVGVGGAVGLRAIGWYFRPGHALGGFELRCPTHRPDPIPCKEEGDNQGNPCSQCAAQADAAAVQATWALG